MPVALPHRNLPLLLLRAREDVISRFRPILTAHGLTEQQWRILRTLAESDNQPLEPREICEICTILSPSLAGVLARMDELGLVKRVRVDSDQRRVLVSLTAKSRALASRIAPLIEREYRALEADVGTELVRETYALLDRLSQRLRAAAAARPGLDAGRPPGMKARKQKGPRALR